MSSLVFCCGLVGFALFFAFPLGALLYISCVLWVFPRLFLVVQYTLLLSITKKKNNNDDIMLLF